ncbi:MAG: site-2 protease family protein, partial [Thermoanaerobaculia bacterium]
YLTCRRYGLPATLPYFLPAPAGLGTLGAFIKIRAPIRTKRELLDVGAAGPIAGFVALLPFLVYGVWKSTPAPVEYAPPDLPMALTLFLPGKCLAIELTSRLFHGPLPPEVVLDYHPFALAAWLGLLATALNLLPLGQLDGGHIFYAANSRLQRRWARLLWAFLALASFRWPGWLLWCAIVLVMGLRHPPVYDETEALGPKRRRVALACLLILVVSFIPVPISVVRVLG